jgi:ribosome recycling factor
MVGLDDILMEAEEKMEKTIAKIGEDLQGVRSGKASPALVENIRVDSYGSSMRMKEVAGITTPEPRLIVIQPWDANNVDPIRKAIEEAKLGITPQVDGKLIRLPIPELSEDRRKDMVKIVNKMGEDGRVAIRHARRDAMDGLKKAKITEDQVKDGEKEVQKLTDKYIADIDKAIELKEAELMKV